MRFGRYADFIPVAVFVVAIGFVFVMDREFGERAERRLADAQSVAERRVGALADVVGNEVSTRIGALEGAKSQYLQVNDADTEAAFLATLDSITTRLQGLTSVSIVDPMTETILRPPGTGFGRSVTLQDTTVRHAYLRALGNRRLAASHVVESTAGRRIYIFDPIFGSDSAVVGMMAAELDPAAIYRRATSQIQFDSIGQDAGNHALLGPDSVRLSTPQPVPVDWGRLVRPVRVADTSWYIELAYPLPDLTVERMQRALLWVGGLSVALAFAVILYFLRRTIRTQKEEIARRQAAEDAARTAAAEARARAGEARELAVQLGAAQQASQQLSTALDPDDVVELFLGGVAEILGADVASLYTFEEEGELLVGRRRVVLRDVEGVTDRLKQEDITQVRAPVALLPALGEAVSTGEPYIVEDAVEQARTVPARVVGAETPVSSVTVPLLIASHTVGVAQWDVYATPRRFDAAEIAFAQALAAPAAAALRTAELFLSLETERRRAAREALRFGAVLDQMADGVIVVDAEGRLERSNAAAEELLGADLTEAPVEEWPARYDIVSVEGRPLSPTEFPLMRAMRGESVRRATFIVRADWSAERHLSCSAGPILDGSGRPAGAAMVLRDVTDEHQYAEMLRHTNRELRRQAEVLEQVNHQLREATKAKDQFLAVMSHELRTPINAIMGYSDLLDLGVKGPLNEDQRHMLGRVRDTSRHLLGLINEVLDLAKIGAGRMDLVLVELDVGELLDRAVEQILPLASGKGLRIEVENASDGRRVIVLADETRLMQILVNLLSNAVKFTQRGQVTAKYADIDGHVAVRVRDTGAGIPPDQVERIFEEFYQVEGGLSRASGGTGLGLAIARRFARLMQGDITVDSEVGKGSTFTLLLPSAERSRAAEDGGSEPTVAVLTHSRTALERFEEDLRGTLYVVGSPEPAQFAAIVRREQPHLIALDARAPEHGAWRAIAALQADAAAVSAPLLLYARQDEEGTTAIELGHFTLLPKPISVEQATDAVLGAVSPDEARGVLIADDDLHVRRILAEALSAAGYDVLTASSGGEALDTARREHPTVAIIDLLMPGLDGLEVIARMRTEPALRNVHVIAIISREPAVEEMERLADSVAAVGSGLRARTLATADVLRAAADAATRRPGSGAIA